MNRQIDENSVNDCDIRRQEVWKKAAKVKLINIPNSPFKLFTFSAVQPLSQLAFTLAEVIITLGIIGITAEITIPTLMQNVKDKNYKIAYKQAYSVASQA